MAYKSLYKAHFKVSGLSPSGKKFKLTGASNSVKIKFDFASNPGLKVVLVRDNFPSNIELPKQVLGGGSQTVEWTGLKPGVYSVALVIISPDGLPAEGNMEVFCDPAGTLVSKGPSQGGSRSQGDLNLNAPGYNAPPLYEVGPKGGFGPVPGPEPGPAPGHPGPWPAPSPSPEPGPWPAPEPGPLPGPWPAPGPQPGSGGGGGTGTGPHPGPWPSPDPSPDPGPEPGPDPTPTGPSPGPGPDPSPDPGPKPGPDPSPDPGPDPGFDPKIPNPGPNPSPDPSPDPGPEPEPSPDPGPDPPDPDDFIGYGALGFERESFSFAQFAIVPDFLGAADMVAVRNEMKQRTTARSAGQDVHLRALLVNRLRTVFSGIAAHLELRSSVFSDTSMNVALFEAGHRVSAAAAAQRLSYVYVVPGEGVGMMSVRLARRSRDGRALATRVIPAPPNALVVIRGAPDLDIGAERQGDGITQSVLHGHISGNFD